jgi:hypothetical protein
MTFSRGAMNGSPKRWSATRKREVVLRVLRGEPLMVVAREVRVAVTELDRWHHQFLESGRAGLRTRPDSWQVRGLREARSTISELRSKIKILEQALREASATGSNASAPVLWDGGGAGPPPVWGGPVTVPPQHHKQPQITKEE